jgi:hypothetical protein
VSWVADIVAGFFRSLFTWLETMRRDKARVEAERDSAVASVDDETDDIIQEIADERSKVSQSSDADDIARRLRERKSTRGSNS